eukprot:579062-Amphidinium_carterae.4
MDIRAQRWSAHGSLRCSGSIKGLFWIPLLMVPWGPNFELHTIEEHIEADFDDIRWRTFLGMEPARKR